jgi:leucine dehydrogenase
MTSGGDVVPIEDLHEIFLQAGIDRACVLNDGNGLQFHAGPGNPNGTAAFELLRRSLTPENGFADHEALFIGRDGEFDTLFFATVHNTRRGLAQGGLRLKEYPDGVRDIIRDGLRLSQGMTRKNALAGLWWGGGKGIIPMSRRLKDALYGKTPDTEMRKRLFQAYGRFVSRLGGTYYTAADLNTDLSDMVDVLSTTRFVTCLPIDRGGSGDPSPMTARGVFESMQAAWAELFGAPLSGVRVAVQGVGKVGKQLAACLGEAGARLWLADIDREVAERVARSLRGERPGVEIQVVSRDEILRAPVDVVAPCAVGGVIDEAAIAALHPDVRLVCGGANNILDNEDRDAALLHARGITFIPDFLCNRMGIINCADEWLGYSAKDVEGKIPGIRDDTRTLLRQVRDRRRNALEEARAMADERLGAEEHPLRELRGRGRKLAEAVATHLAQ